MKKTITFDTDQWRLVPVKADAAMRLAAGDGGDTCMCCGYDNGAGNPGELFDVMVEHSPEHPDTGRAAFTFQGVPIVLNGPNPSAVVTVITQHGKVISELTGTEEVIAALVLWREIQKEIDAYADGGNIIRDRWMSRSLELCQSWVHVPTGPHLYTSNPDHGEEL